MKIQLMMAVEVYANLHVFGDLILTVDKRRKIKKAAELLEKEKKFYDEELQQLIEVYTLKDEKGLPIVKNNEYVFEDDIKKGEYISKVIELRKCEIDLDIEKINISIAEQTQLKISIRQEDLLSNIFNFEE